MRPATVNAVTTLPIFIEERSGIRRVAEPVTVGLPFPRGWLPAPGLLELRDPLGQPAPLQVAALLRWSDGSVKWALLDFQASVEPLTTAVYHAAVASQKPADNALPAMMVEEFTDWIVVDTGAASFCMSKRRFAPFQRVLIRGQELLQDGASETNLTDERGERYVPEIDRMEVDTTGLCRTTVAVRGWFRDSSRRPYAEFTGCLTFFRNSGTVEIRFTIRNPRAARHRGGFWDLGDPGSLYLKDLSIALAVASSSAPQIGWLDGSAATPDEARAKLEIYQDSSGGDNWKSPNHVNRHGVVVTAFRGYRVVVDGVPRRWGHRASPVVTVRDAGRSLTVAVEGFWQNFPKVVAVNGGRIRIGLFPAEYGDVHELQGGEQKTHVLLFHAGTESVEPSGLRWAHDRLVPRAAPAWYAETRAIPYLTPAASPAAPSRWLSEADALVDTAVSGPESFFDRREIIDEYGWRHFGDLYADHETVGFSGPGTLVAHYNNQYDVLYGAAVQYLRSGDRRWFDLMRDLARHVIDIDVYHTNRDRAAFNGGLFWHTEHYMDAGTSTHRTYSRSNIRGRQARACGGGPSSEHSYTSGLLTYYCLTGDPLGAETVQELAEWVIAMDDGRRRRGGWLDRRCTGHASRTVSRDYHGPGRGAGNSINALLDGYVVRGEPRYLAKAEELVRRVIHPSDDIARRGLEDVEHRWSYTVFLQVLGKYLDMKTEAGVTDWMFSYARESLLHYARWIARYEVPYKVVLDRVEIPTETWPAQDIRKANVLAIAAKYAAEHDAAIFSERADFFFRTCVSDLLSFETARLTRPIAILMTNAYVQASSEWRTRTQDWSQGPAHDFGQPRDFVPQFAALYRLRAGVATLLRQLR